MLFFLFPRLRTPLSLEPSSAPETVDKPVARVSQLHSIPSLGDDQDEQEDMDLDTPDDKGPVPSVLPSVSNLVQPAFSM